DLRISGGRIAEIGTNLTAADGARVFDCTGLVALPGLVNTHHHFFQSLTRCLPAAQNVPLFDWLTYHYGVWRHVRAESMRAAARLAISELLLSGCTTTSDHHYLFPPSVSDDLLGIEIEAARELGVRFCGTRGSMTLGESRGGLPPDDLMESDDRVLRRCEEAISRYHDPSPLSMCRVHIAPCSPFNVTTELLRDSAHMAKRLNVRLHTHLAETMDENEFCLEKFGKRPLDYMEELGWLGDNVWFAHGIHFTDDELSRLARAGTGISHCASSNMRLGSGVCRVPEMLAKKIPVGLAVDGSASNDSGDMLAELRQVLLLARVRYGSAALTARQVIGLATRGSASVLGFEEIGTLEAGKAADVALFSLDELAYAGAADPMAALLFCGGSHRARHVIVNGEIVVEDGRLVHADEENIRRAAASEAKQLWQRAGL
ncbi:MAG: 8-oxoguanine deaminase, partial [bacterium]|nr:8-oxoguanine deaminase [bacterium]